VEYAANVRSDQKVGNGINKPLLVGAVDDPLLLRAGAASKKGFSFPMDRWMKSSADELQEMATSGDIVNRRAAGALWKSFRAGHLHWSRAWALSVLAFSLSTHNPALRQSHCGSLGEETASKFRQVQD
jgi:hypothetical protein